MKTILNPFFFLIILLLIDRISNWEGIDISNYTYPKKDDDPNVFTVAILHTNDIHGTYFPQKVTLINGNEYELGGLEYLAKYITKLRKDWGDQFVYFDGGDQFQGGYESKITDGKIITDYFNTLGVKATALGNHEWDFGQDFLKNRIKESESHYIIANMQNDAGSPHVLPNQTVTEIYTFGNVKIGVIGITTVLTVETTTGDLSGMHFIEYKNVIVKEAEKLRNGENKVNAVILLAHVGLKCKKDGEEKMKLKVRTKETEQKECNQSDEIYKLLRILPKGTIDAVLAAHKHDVTHHWVFDTPVTGSDRNGLYASILYLNFDVTNNYALMKDKIQIEGPLPVCSKVFKNTLRCDVPSEKEEEKFGELSPFSFHGEPIEKDEILQSVTNKYIEEYNKKAGEYLTKTKVTFYQAKAGEEALGNLYCDFLRKITGTDVSIVNAGDFRTAWRPGDVTYGSLYSMFPFENDIVSFEITGKELRRMIYETQTGIYSYYPTSGLKQVVYETTKKELISVKLFDGINEIEIDDKKIYSVTTNDFCMPYKDGVLGGDDFRRVTKWIKPQNKKNHGELREMLKEYLKLIPELIKSNYVDENNPRLRIIKAQNE